MLDAALLPTSDCQIVVQLAAATTLLTNGEVADRTGELGSDPEAFMQQLESVVPKYPYGRALIHLGGIDPLLTGEW